MNSIGTSLRMKVVMVAFTVLTLAAAAGTAIASSRASRGSICGMACSPNHICSGHTCACKWGPTNPIGTCIAQ
jgi:hypothetical protein